jgi:hypothetical protein
VVVREHMLRGFHLAKQQAILRIPDVVRSGTISTQPWNTVNLAQVKSLRKVVLGEDFRSNRNGTRRSTVLVNWLAYETFRLIKELQSESLFKTIKASVPKAIMGETLKPRNTAARGSFREKGRLALLRPPLQTAEGMLGMSRRAI